MAAEVMLPLKLQGIAEVADNALVLRFKFTARPVKPSWVQREYLKRMYQVFAEKGIRFASGALMLQTAAAARAGAAGPRRRRKRRRRGERVPRSAPLARETRPRPGAAA